MDGAVAALAFGGITLTRVLSREVAFSVHVREIGLKAVLVSNNAHDAQMLIALLDTDGNPLLDINGQYLLSDTTGTAQPGSPVTPTPPSMPGTPTPPAVLNTLDSFVLDQSTLG